MVLPITVHAARATGHSAGNEREIVFAHPILGLVPEDGEACSLLACLAKTA